MQVLIVTTGLLKAIARNSAMDFNLLHPRIPGSATNLSRRDQTCLRKIGGKRRKSNETLLLSAALIEAFLLISNACFRDFKCSFEIKSQFLYPTYLTNVRDSEQIEDVQTHVTSKLS